VQTKNGPLVLAYGRDPYFDDWPDTLQLNYGNPDLQQAMIGELERIAGQCDGVRCDMAMLLLPVSSINTSKLARRRKVAQDENFEARNPQFETILNDQNTRNNKINSVSISWV